MAITSYNENVFVNCPFDDEYRDIFYAKVFCIFDCGFIARCAQEEEDSGEVRIEKIARIILGCKYGIHDISRTELCKKTQLPRFNMPFELGMFLGAKRYGDKYQKKKICLITDKDKYRFQTFISDIAGQDIRAHSSDPEEAIKLVRTWLKNHSKKAMSGGADVVKRYRKFREQLPVLCEQMKIGEEEITFNDYTQFTSWWLQNQRTILL